MTDISGSGLTVQFPRVPIAGGIVNIANLINYPADSAPEGLDQGGQCTPREGFSFSDDHATDADSHNQEQTTRQFEPGPTRIARVGSGWPNRKYDPVEALTFAAV